MRPPIFDSPTTRGLFDPTTGVYWASDSFATPMLAPVRDVDELDRSESVGDARPLWATRRCAPEQFCRRDYLDGSERPLRDAMFITPPPVRPISAS